MDGGAVRSGNGADSGGVGSVSAVDGTGSVYIGAVRAANRVGSVCNGAVRAAGHSVKERLKVSSFGDGFVDR